ncbi:MAG: TIGR04255 family protein [Phycisphaerales bacterium]
MPQVSRNLPEFAKPPVTEVALAVQFEPIEITAAHLGLLALRMRELGYPRIEQHPPLAPIVEQFGAPRVPGRVVFALGLPEVRNWFVAEDGQRLVQVQSDRLIHNWRKSGTANEYPRYEKIRETFGQHLQELAAFVTREGLGEILPNQVEVTYVNHVRSVGAPLGGGQLARVTGIAGSSYTDRTLPAAEDARAAARFVIEREGTPVGRLHVNAHTAIDLENREPIVVVSLTARGRPFTQGLDGVLSFMDLGREWVVRGFADVTTPEMHKVWERKS